MVQYSVFVSIFIIGMICGSVWSGKTGDVLGRRCVSCYSLIKSLNISNEFGKLKKIIIILNINTHSLLVAGEMQALGVADMFCITGWLAIAFAKVCLFYSFYLNKHDRSLELQPSNNVMFNAS